MYPGLSEATLDIYIIKLFVHIYVSYNSWPNRWTKENKLITEWAEIFEGTLELGVKLAKKNLFENSKFVQEKFNILFEFRFLKF